MRHMQSVAVPAVRAAASLLPAMVALAIPLSSQAQQAAGGGTAAQANATTNNISREQSNGVGFPTRSCTRWTSTSGAPSGLPA